jgi:hypothetical protein
MDDNPSQFFLRGKYKKKIPFFAVESYISIYLDIKTIDIKQCSAQRERIALLFS